MYGGGAGLGSIMPAYGAGAHYELRGAGIGSIFSNIFRGVVPIVKKVLGLGARAIKTPIGKSIVKEAKKTALEAGLNVMGDALQGKNVVKSAKQQAKKAISNMGDKIQKTALQNLAPATRNKSGSNSNKRKKRIKKTKTATVRRGGGRGRGNAAGKAVPVSQAATKPRKKKKRKNKTGAKMVSRAADLFDY